jgi:hypothetical protein
MSVIIDGTSGVNTPNTFAFKNRLINAQLLINQRGVSGTVSLSAGAYGHDRFKAGDSGCTYTFSTTNNVTTLTISAGSLQQVIEGLNLESGTYTLSWTGTAQGKIGAGSYGASGITGSITGGTNTTIEFNTGTLSLPQLEVGSTATSFDYRPYGTELQLCQRYYVKFVGRGANDYSSVAVGTVASSNAAELTCFLPVELRTKPTVSFGGTLYIGDGGSYPTLSSIGSNWGGRNTLYFSVTASSSTLTVGRGAYLYTNTASTDFFALSAEL